MFGAGADYHERGAGRVNARNCYRTREWDTRMNSIDLAIPRLH